MARVGSMTVRVSAVRASTSPFRLPRFLRARELTSGVGPPPNDLRRDKSGPQRLDLLLLVASLPIDQFLTDR